MSFCSQALIGFCKAETGLSKDVGVALSMGQGEPVPIQPWTLPPTHPLSLRIPSQAVRSPAGDHYHPGAIWRHFIESGRFLAL